METIKQQILNFIDKELDTILIGENGIQSIEMNVQIRDGIIRVETNIDKVKITELEDEK